MSNFLARCAAVGIVGGGFAVTGDLGWLADRGVRLVNARTVPTKQQPSEEPQASGQPVGFAVSPAAAPAPTNVQPALTPIDPIASAGIPAARSPHEPVPPPNAPAQVDLGAIPAGSRVTVWISPPAARSARAASRQPCVAFDIVDPATGEALMHGGGSAAKRVTIQPAGSSAAGRILIKGGMIRVVPVGLAHGARGPADGETIGPIAAMATDR